MDIKETIAKINQMQADGVIKRYAIGGAVGATLQEPWQRFEKQFLGDTP